MVLATCIKCCRGTRNRIGANDSVPWFEIVSDLSANAISAREMMPTRRQFAALCPLLASVLGSAAPAFGAHSSFGYLRRLRVNFPRAANGFTTASLPPPMDIEVGRLGHAQSLLSPTRLSSTRLIPLIGFRANLVGEAGNIATRPLCGRETPDRIGETKRLSEKSSLYAVQEARTLALTRRGELWSAQISTGGPAWVPQHASRPTAVVGNENRWQQSRAGSGQDSVAYHQQRRKA